MMHEKSEQNKRDRSEQKKKERETTHSIKLERSKPLNSATMSKSPPFSLYVCCMYICGEHDVKHIVCWGCDEDDDSTLFTPKKFYYLFLYLYSVVGKTKISFFMTDGAGSNAHPFSDAHCTLMNSSWHMYLSTRCGKLFFTRLLLLLLPSLHRHRCDRIVCRRK